MLGVAIPIHLHKWPVSSKEAWHNLHNLDSAGTHNPNRLCSTATSSKADSYADGSQGVMRAMFVVKVIAGNVKKRYDSYTEEDQVMISAGALGLQPQQGLGLGLRVGVYV